MLAIKSYKTTKDARNENFRNPRTGLTGPQTLANILTARGFLEFSERKIV